MQGPARRTEVDYPDDMHVLLPFAGYAAKKRRFSAAKDSDILSILLDHVLLNHVLNTTDFYRNGLLKIHAAIDLSQLF